MSESVISTEIWAHRGVASFYPENTIEAFEEAMACGADGIELDVRLSRDGEIIVFHDETLRRLAGIKRQIQDMKLSEIQNIRLQGFLFAGTVPTMRQVFETLKNTSLTLNIEVKSYIRNNDMLERKLLELTNEFEMQDQVIYSSFNPIVIRRFKALDCPSRLAILFRRKRKKMLKLAKRLAVDAVHPHWLLLRDAEDVQSFHDAGIQVHTWTTDDLKRVKKLIEWGVDSIICNYPYRVLDLRNKLGSMPQTLSD